MVNLSPGQTATFGRGTAECPVDITLPDDGVSRLAGRVLAVEDHWLISNLSPRTTYIVENPEGGGEFVKLAPRRLDMPVPFEFSRVVVPGRTGPASFLVFAAQHVYADHTDLVDGSPDATRVAFPLDETAKYFLVLVTLCEPRLRDCSSPVIPTVPEILDRLSGLPAAADLTRSAINFHIGYLAGAKLRVKTPHDGDKVKADWQRSALVSLALQFDLVRAEHLDLLPPPPGRP
ncbi:MAG: serine/threonine protein kinase [Micromonosporaceae bacterium]|nr:serine/threonine protein kinase [Micromonosporaceae bacterium]